MKKGIKETIQVEAPCHLLKHVDVEVGTMHKPNLYLATLVYL